MATQETVTVPREVFEALVCEALTVERILLFQAGGDVDLVDGLHRKAWAALEAALGEFEMNAAETEFVGWAGRVNQQVSASVAAWFSDLAAKTARDAVAAQGFQHA